MGPLIPIVQHRIKKCQEFFLNVKTCNIVLTFFRDFPPTMSDEKLLPRPGDPLLDQMCFFYAQTVS